MTALIPFCTQVPKDYLSMYSSVEADRRLVSGGFQPCCTRALAKTEAVQLTTSSITRVSSQHAWSPRATSHTQTVQTESHTENYQLLLLSFIRAQLKPSPALSSHLTDCSKRTELQIHVTSHQKLLCCPLASSSNVFAITGHPLLWSSAHTEPSILSMLWSPSTVFKFIYSQFT